jgi:uncharacterized protein YlxW (UPF0749 family)
MRKQIAVLLACGALVLGGCADKEKERELQAQMEKYQSDRSSLQTALNDREQFVEEILKSVNEIYADLERARSKEGKLIQGGTGVSEGPWVSSPGTRSRILKNINEIGDALAENRKRVNTLQARVRDYRGQVENLNGLLEQLKTTLQERETAIAQLKAQVQGLEKTVAEQTLMVSDRDRTIEEQKKQIGTAYYIAGTRDELEEKGIITEEGGFLWGLLGSTTTIASGMDLSHFTPIDREAMNTIHIQGEIEEILPHRKAEYYATAEMGEGATDLKILKPGKFWQGNHLVVVLD